MKIEVKFNICMNVFEYCINADFIGRSLSRRIGNEVISLSTTNNLSTTYSALIPVLFHFVCDKNKNTKFSVKCFDV